MSDAPDKMWVAPFPTLADAVAGDWPSPANKEERLYLRKDLHDAATRQARNDALREAEEKVVNRLNEELAAMPDDFTRAVVLNVMSKARREVHALIQDPED